MASFVNVFKMGPFVKFPSNIVSSSYENSTYLMSCCNCDSAEQLPVTIITDTATNTEVSYKLLSGIPHIKGLHFFEIPLK